VEVGRLFVGEGLEIQLLAGVEVVLSMIPERGARWVFSPEQLETTIRRLDGTNLRFDSFAFVTRKCGAICDTQSVESRAVIQDPTGYARLHPAAARSSIREDWRV
jgi:hypothetical protein